MEEAKAKIFKLHPLKLTPPAKVFPTFKMCLCSSRSGKRVKELQALLKEEHEEQDQHLVRINLIFLTNFLQDSVIAEHGGQRFMNDSTNR